MEKDLFRAAVLRLFLAGVLFEFEMIEGSEPWDAFFEVVGSEAGVVCSELACLQLVGSEAWGALLVLADGMFISSMYL